MLSGEQTVTGFRERAIVFGPDAGLLGIVTDPADRLDLDQPAVVFINTGIIHRVGDNRLSTIWARRLAAAGKTVLRFDLSGIGDSERRQDDLSLVDATLADIRAAIDWLATHRRVRRVILIGTCMGADRALVYAGSDIRVVGTVLIDPSTPPTWRFYLRRYARAILDVESWRRLLAKWIRAPQSLQRYWRGGLHVSLANSRQPNPLSLRDFFADAYQASVKANIRTLAIFTGGIAFRYNYREQLIDAFPEVGFNDLLQLEYLEKKDHLISLEADRLELFALTDAWLNAISSCEIASAQAKSDICPRSLLASSLQSTELEF